MLTYKADRHLELKFDYLNRISTQPSATDSRFDVVSTATTHLSVTEKSVSTTATSFNQFEMTSSLHGESSTQLVTLSNVTRFQQSTTYSNNVTTTTGTSNVTRFKWSFGPEYEVKPPIENLAVTEKPLSKIKGLHYFVVLFYVYYKWYLL